MMILRRPNLPLMESPLAAATTGLLTGAALIIAIGAQNAYVLRLGIRRQHVLPVVAICALSDALLIAAGVGGMGALVEAAPTAITAIRWIGAVFLITYGLMAARRAFHAEHLEAATGPVHVSRRTAVLTTLAFTWLNPHVGSVATTHADRRWWFGAGAAAASLLWFAGLGYGARLLAPLFEKPLAWRILDGTIAVVMLTLGATLALGH